MRGAGVKHAPLKQELAMKLPPSRGSSAPDSARTRPEKKPAELRRQERFIKEGRGQGTGANYKPYILVEKSGFQSRGRSHLLFNPQLGRHHHLLSDLELLTFIWAWSFQAADYREQFPLQRYELDPLFLFLPKRALGTTEIERSLGIKHPSITKNDPRIMTTDLLVTFADQTHVAIHAKYRKEQLEASDRQIDLKLIEKQYWRSRDVKLLVVDETRYTEGRANQMIWALDGMFWNEGGAALAGVLRCLNLTSHRAPMNERLHAAAHATGVCIEDATRAFKFAMLTRQWVVQLGIELVLSNPWPSRPSRIAPVLSARSFKGAFT